MSASLIKVIVIVIVFNIERSQCRTFGICISRGKQAYQISTYSPSYQARLAVDGNRKSLLRYPLSGSHTRQVANPWWYVDLGQEYPIGDVNVYIRTGQWFANFDIVITNARPPPVSGHICYRHFGGSQNEQVRSIYCRAAWGRYVAITLRSPSPTYLILCEVEVFADDGMVAFDLHGYLCDACVLNYHYVADQPITASNGSLAVLTEKARTDVECAMRCSTLDWCHEYHFKEVPAICVLYRAVQLVTPEHENMMSPRLFKLTT